MTRSTDTLVLDGSVQLLYKNALAANAAIILVAPLIVAYLYPFIDHTWLFSWLGLMFIASMIRLMVYHDYHQTPDKYPVERWAYLYTLATLVTGLSWALSSMFILHSSDPGVISAIYLMLFGVLTVAVPSLSSVQPAFYAHVVPVGLAISLFYFVNGTRISFYLSIAGILYTVLVMIIGRNINQRTIESIRLEINNSRLIERLNREISERKGVQKLLEHHQEELERLVRKRTEQLFTANVDLEKEVAERKRAEENLKHLAHHDALTNLPNRLLLDDRLEHAISAAHRNEEQVALFFIDLDHFKHINDSLGHEIGDKLLQEIGNKLQTCIRETDTVARLGGDEFIVVLEQVHSMDNVNKLARKILDAVTSKFVIMGNDLYTSASIGISVFPNDGDNPRELIKNADAAMYKAKEDGRHNYQFYTQELTASAYDRVLMESGLSNAIERDELIVYYQPQVSLVDNGITGVEALARWLHPDYGLLAPEIFLPVAEKSGLIIPMGEKVLRLACEQMVQWKQQLPEIDFVAVNLANAQIREGTLVEKVTRILDETGCQPEWLELEITEDFILKDTEYAINTLKSLRDIGISLAIDDFGTGYSSLSYLKKLPVTKLKIDRSFIADLARDTDDVAIIRAIMALGENMGLEIIAEGIENQRQEAFLKTQNCVYAQGFYYSHPLPADRISDFLKE